MPQHQQRPPHTTHKQDHTRKWWWWVETPPHQQLSPAVVDGSITPRNSQLQYASHAQPSLHMHKGGAGRTTCGTTTYHAAIQLHMHTNTPHAHTHQITARCSSVLCIHTHTGTNISNELNAHYSQTARGQDDSMHHLRRSTSDLQGFRTGIAACSRIKASQGCSDHVCAVPPKHNSSTTFFLSRCAAKAHTAALATTTCRSRCRVVAVAVGAAKKNNSSRLAAPAACTPCDRHLCVLRHSCTHKDSSSYVKE